ncbi:MAG: diguanylate cyclase [Sulfuricaulis sp.]|uniref:diguanylate cyclase n=1 Tax=Sulfuricaulis sp. TaxID=2003553 RepID=UPI0025DE23CB|nr:diguanylate cyclase [Sulfuricaulis sp.]MCR4347453.1 diguanylate cyclase [Sulfuricaulis sp.]
MPLTPLHVLIVEDSETDTELLLRELRRAGYDPVCERVETADAMSAALDGQDWDIVISDFTMPRFNGMEALRLVQQLKPDIPFIIVSGTIGEDRAVAAMKAGAHDYIMKGNLARLVPAIERELKEAAVRHEYRRAQERIQHLAFYDPLTDLPNRTLFTERLQQAVLTGRRKKHCFALMVMDLDHFKDINDTLGHHAGDQVLQQAAARVKSCARASDTVARKILAAFSRPLQIGDRNFDIGASLGIALFPEHGNETDSLMCAADAAMYEAKHTQSGFKVYSPDLGQKSGVT